MVTEIGLRLKFDVYFLLLKVVSIFSHLFYWTVVRSLRRMKAVFVSFYNVPPSLPLLSLAYLTTGCQHMQVCRALKLNDPHELSVLSNSFNYKA